MNKITSTLSDGQWHHFSDIASIWYATIAYRNGYLERKEEEVIIHKADGKESKIKRYVFKLKNPDGKLI